MNKPRVAIFIHHPECSIQSAHGILRCLSANYEIDFFGQNELYESRFKKCDLIAFPGGIGDSESFHRIIGSKADVIGNLIQRGFRYLGICMGAYWAGPHYFNICHGIKPKQYIKRSSTDIRRSFATVATVTWQKQMESMFFYDGCCMIGNRKNFEVVAEYTNGDAAAVIQGNIGLIGPHPESDKYWYDRSYLQPYWHSYQHDKLLLAFVDQLMLK